MLALGLRFIEANMHSLDHLEGIVRNPRLQYILAAGLTKELAYNNEEQILKGLVIAAISKIKEATRNCKTEREKTEAVYYIINMHPVLELAIVAFVRAAGCLHLD